MYTDQRYNDKQNSPPLVSPTSQDAENPTTESSKLLNTHSRLNQYSFSLPVVGSKNDIDFRKQALLGNCHDDFTRHGGNSTVQTGVDYLLSFVETTHQMIHSQTQQNTEHQQSEVINQEVMLPLKHRKNTFSCLALSYYLTYATVTSSVAAVVMTQLAYYNIITENKTSRRIELASSAVFTLASLGTRNPNTFAKYHLEDQQTITKKGCNKTTNHTSASTHVYKNKRQHVQYTHVMGLRYIMWHRPYRHPFNRV